MKQTQVILTVRLVIDKNTTLKEAEEIVADALTLVRHRTGAEFKAEKKEVVSNEKQR